MSRKKMIDEPQAVVFRLEDGREFEGVVKRINDNDFHLVIEELPEEPWTVLEKLEAKAKKEDDKYLFLEAHFAGRNSHINRTASTSTTIFRPTVTLYTNDPDNPLSQDVSSMDVKVENLDLWFNQSLFHFNNPMHMQDTIDYKLQSEVGKFKFKDFELEFGLAIGGMTYSRLQRGVNLNQGAYIHLRRDGKNYPYIEYVEALKSVQRLIGLAFRSQIMSYELDVCSAEFGLMPNKQNMPAIFPAYSIILSNVMPAVPEIDYVSDLAFTLDQLPDFQKVLDKWAQIEGDLLPIVDLYLSSVSGKGLILENVFLNRVQAIEGFHRAFRNGLNTPKDQYLIQKKRILGKFTGEDKDLLKRVLKYGNQYSLEQRVTELNKELQLKGIATIMVCNPSILANTRNYYSHLSNDITNTCPSKDFGELTHQCGQMLYALILLELGIGKELVYKAVRNMDRF